MRRYPKIGDHIQDRLSNPPKRGVITKTYYDNAGYRQIQVQFDDDWMTTSYDESEYFTEENGGCGRWSNMGRCWIIEDSNEDRLPENHPANISFKKTIEELNLKLLKERLGEDVNLSVAELLLISIKHRTEADDLGKKSDYYGYYRSKAEDYALMAQYKQGEV